MKVWLTDLLWALGAFLLQVSFLGVLFPANWQPDLLLGLALARGSAGGEAAGFRMGLLAGLLADLYSGRVFGAQTLALAALGAMAGLWRRRLYFDALLTPALLILVGLPAKTAFIALLAHLFRGTPLDLIAVWPGIGRMLANLVMAPPLFRLWVQDEGLELSTPR